jgi:hypothetical protein
VKLSRETLKREATGQYRPPTNAEIVASRGKGCHCSGRMSGARLVADMKKIDWLRPSVIALVLANLDFPGDSIRFIAILAGLLAPTLAGTNSIQAID